MDKPRSGFLVCLIFSSFCLFIASASAGHGKQPGKASDYVLKGGKVYTVNSEQPWAEAVAVKGKKIVYVGSNEGAKHFVGPTTEVMDLKGAMLLPGFIEAHIHPLMGAALTMGVDLQYDTKEELFKALENYSREISGETNIVRGFGWRYHIFPETGPRKEDLDRIWPTRPVMLIAIDGHSAWVNSKAMELAGVGLDTPDPFPGFSYFQRDPQTGDATGYLVEGPVVMQVAGRLEPFTEQSMADAFVKWLPRASAAGITGVFEAGAVLYPDQTRAYDLYMDLEKRGELPFRVVGCYYHNNPDVDPLPLIRELRKRYRSELVQASVLKLNIDGGDAQYTAAMLSPYDDKPKECGSTLLPPDLYKRIIRQADAEGIDIHVHSYGDRATHLSLDAFEEASRANATHDRRHTLCHLVLVDPEDIPRFGQLGVIGEFSIQWAAPDAYWKRVQSTRWGEERARRIYRPLALLKTGARVTFGTDWPAAGYYSTYRPLEAIQIGLTRQELGKPDGEILPPGIERLSIAQLIRGYTLDAAYQIRLDDRVGSIEAGKLADLIVLEKDLFEVPPHEIAATKLLLTMMNGKVRYRDGI
jgi:predicted amidohydrolase YtcJ